MQRAVWDVVNMERTGDHIAFVSEGGNHFSEDTMFLECLQPGGISRDLDIYRALSDAQ